MTYVYIILSDMRDQMFIPPSFKRTERHQINTVEARFYINKRKYFSTQWVAFWNSMRKDVVGTNRPILVQGLNELTEGIPLEVTKTPTQHKTPPSWEQLEA